MPVPVLIPRNALAVDWTDWLQQQDTPAFLCTPADRHELVALLGTAPDLARLRIRARGAGHSSSEVGAPRRGGFLVGWDRFQLDHEQEASRWWKADLSTARPDRIRGDATLVRVAAGTTIQALNARLAGELPARALINLGSYDHQTIFGAIATGTHGSGMVAGPLADLVASIEMVCVVDDGHGKPAIRSVRVEPVGGVTDPNAFNADQNLHRMDLLQNDELFYSAVVGLGCFGIVTAVTLQVVPAFWLREWRELLRWSELKPILAARAANDYFDVNLTSLPIRTGFVNEHRCLLTTRVAIPVQPGLPPPRDDARLAQLRSEAQKHPPRDALTRYLADLGSDAPLIGNQCAYDHAFQAEVDLHPAAKPFCSNSAVVFRTSVGDYVYATSLELAVDQANSADAIDTVIAHAKAMHDEGYHHLSPYGIRWVRQSNHVLAPTFARDSCTIEAPILLGARKRFQSIDKSPGDITFMLGALQTRFMQKPYGARFHWGQRNTLGYADVAARYPRFENTWLPLYRRYNAFGTFDNAWTDRLGISVNGP